ncbi:hypothetical protein [Pseudoxanthomonas sp. UTMC 1351]|uniref:LIC_13387 family protein n=1 Tax=Pseudoxanthomonas sp. UTMC 1351 TaxID=2695853 RepID=UPI0034CD3776
MVFRFYRTGAWLWIITGITHNLFDLLSRLFPSAAKEPVRTALHNLSFEFLGMHSDYYQLTMGFSLAMGTSIALAGVLFLLIARLTTDTAVRARPACVVGLVASMVLLALSVTVLQLPPPMVTFALATLAFAAALFTSARSGAISA